MLRIRSRHIALPLSYLVLLGCGSQDPQPNRGDGEAPSGGSSSAGASQGGAAGVANAGGEAGTPAAGSGGSPSGGASPGGAGGAPTAGTAGVPSTGGVAGVGGAAGESGAAGVGGVGATGGVITAGIGGVGGNPLCDVVFYLDADADGFGTANTTVVDCAAPSGYVAVAGDCNDADPNNWASCASCRDRDFDGHFAGCDAYVTLKGADCDDTRPWINQDMVDAPPLDSSDTEDWDCNGSDIAVDESVGAFVSPQGDDANPGTRTQPVRTLKRGIDIAETHHLYAVFVAAGTYSEHVSTSVSIFGGYDPLTWERDALAHFTRLTAPSDGALTIESGAKIALQGFEVQGSNAGTSSDSSPIRANDSTFVMHSVRVSGGNSVAVGGEVAGIALADTNAFVVKSDVYSGTAAKGTYGVRASRGWTYLEGSSVSMSQVTPATTSAGVAMTGGRGTFWASSVMGGRAISSYGILAESSTSLHLLDSTVHSGSSLSEWTGADAPAGCVGVRVSGGSATIQSSSVMSAQDGTECFLSRALDSASALTAVNVLLHAGTAPTGAALRQRSGQSLIVSSTLVSNVGLEGSAWELWAGSLGVAVSSIFYFHTDTGIQASGTLQSLYNDIWSPTSDCLIQDGLSVCSESAQAVNAKYCLLPACGNTSVDPKFDSHLQISSDSPCVNAGIDPKPWFAGPIVDLNGQLRPLGGSYDQGAFEVR